MGRLRDTDGLSGRRGPFELADHRGEQVVKFTDHRGHRAACCPRYIMGRPGWGGRQPIKGDGAWTMSEARTCGARVRSCSDGATYWPNNWGQSRQPRSWHHSLLRASPSGHGATTLTSQIRLPSHGLDTHVAAVTRRCQRTYPGVIEAASRHAMTVNGTGLM